MTTKTKATATFEVKKWDEKKPDPAEPGGWLARGTIATGLAGDVEGEATTEFLMLYVGNESASYVGMQRVTARLGGRSGSFVMQGSGTYVVSTGIARTEWSVVPGSGTGELAGLRGDWHEFAQKDPKGTITFEYAFE